jgi:hypothetical protein
MHHTFRRKFSLSERIPVSQMHISCFKELSNHFRFSVVFYAFHEEKSNKMHNVSKFYYSIFIRSSTCFGRQTTHQQVPKIALCPTKSTIYTSNLSCMKNQRGCQCSFRLLTMGGVSPETCRASYKYGTIKILIHSYILLDFSLWIVLWCTDPRTSCCTLLFEHRLDKEDSFPPSSVNFLLGLRKSHHPQWQFWSHFIHLS